MKNKKFIFSIIGIFLLSLTMSFGFTCVETNSYTMQPMGWRVRTFHCSTTHPLTGEVIQSDFTIIDDPNTGTVYFTQERTYKMCVELPSDDQNSLILYPNPAKNQFNLKILSQDKNKSEFKFYNSNLQEISLQATYSNNENIIFDTTELTNGYYFLILNSNNNFSIYKLIIQK